MHFILRKTGTGSMRWLQNQHHQFGVQRTSFGGERQQQNDDRQQQHSRFWSSNHINKLGNTASWLIGLGIGWYLVESYSPNSNAAMAQSDDAVRSWHMTHRPDLPNFKERQVQQHNEQSTGIWVTYGVGVYDVTKYVPKHPGGDAILMAAGSAVEQFFASYKVHSKRKVLQLLEGMRIGNLEK